MEIKYRKLVCIGLLAVGLILPIGCANKKKLNDMQPNDKNMASMVNKDAKSNVEMGTFFNENDLKASDGVPIIWGDYKLSDCIEIPSLQGVEYGEITAQAPTEDKAILLAKLGKPTKLVDELSSGAEMGDTVTMDLRVTAGNSVLNPMTLYGSRIPLGTGTTDPKIEEIIVGLKTGDEVKKEIKYENDYRNKMLSGKTVSCDIKVIQIHRPDMPTAQEVKEARFFLEKNFDYAKKHQKQQTAKQFLRENAIIKAYPQDMVRRIRISYEKRFIGSKYKNIGDFFKATGTNEREFKSAESDYILQSIKDELILTALSSETGINEESEDFKKNLPKREISNDEKNDILYETILTKMLRT